MTRRTEITGIAKGGLILLFAIFLLQWDGEAEKPPPREITLIPNVYLFLIFG